MQLPGDPINLSREELTRLGGTLAEMVEELEEQHFDLFKAVERSWDYYEAKPQVEMKSEPFEGASNIEVPIVRTAADAITSRYYNAVHGTNKIWVGATQNEEFRTFVDDIVDWLNFTARNEFNLSEATEPWMTELVVVGSSVLMLQWVNRQKYVYTRGREGKAKPNLATFYTGPEVRHVPREQVLWDSNWDIGTAPIIARQSLLTTNDLNLFTQTDDYLIEGVEKSKGHSITNHGSGSLGIWFKKTERDGSDPDRAVERLGLHDIREIWTTLPVLKGRGFNLPMVEGETDEPIMPIQCVIDQTAKEVLRIVPKPYMIPDWPFYAAYFRRRSGRASSPGVADMLYHIQHGVSTLTNQSVDAVSLANSLSGFTNDPRMQDIGAKLNRLIYTDNLDGVKEFKTSKQILPDINLINLLVGMGERVTGISDPFLGRETRMGGHPSPATSTIARLQEGNKLFIFGIRSIRNQLTRLGNDIATLYQLMMTDDDGKIERALGPKDARSVREFIFPTDLPITTNLELELNALSESMNPDTERQKAMMVFQVTHNFFTITMQYLQIAANPQAPPQLKAAATKAVEGLGKAYEEVLKNSDVDDLESFLFRLNEVKPEANALGQFANGVGGGGGPVGPPQQGVGGNGSLPVRPPGSGL